MTDWWLSWYSPSGESFELHSPWWVSGSRSDDNAATVVAAIRAESEEAAWEQVRLSYNNPPLDVERRFIQVLDRSPFSDRFPRDEWMEWDDERTCGCPVHTKGG